MVEIKRPNDVKDGDVVDINDETGKFVGKLIIPTGSVAGKNIYFDIPSDPHRVPVNAILPVLAEQRLISSGAEELVPSLASLRSGPAVNASGFGPSTTRDPRLAVIEEDNPEFPGRVYPHYRSGLPSADVGGKTTKPKKSSKKTKKNRKIINQLKKLLKEI